MTREEIVDSLEDYTVGRLKKERVHITVKELQKYIDEIKALGQEPCEDAISRQAVLEQTYLWSKGEFLRVAKPFDYLRKRINSLPSVTPKPKTDILDKIRAEIDSYCSDNRDRNDGLYIAMQIIDKYKTESEVKEMAENEEDKELIVNKDVYDTLTEEQKKFVDIGLSYFNNRKRGIKNENRR